MEEYGYIKIKYDKNFIFSKVYINPIKELGKDITSLQKSIIYSMLGFIGYDNIIRKGGGSNGTPYAPKEFSKAIGMPYETYRKNIKALKDKGIIKQGKKLLKDYEDKEIIIVNPFVCSKGERMRIDILELFEDTKYSHLCESEKEDGRKSYRYEKWKNKIIARDGFKCTICGRTEGLEVHHILPYEDNPEKRLDIDNGITLCKFCHSNKYPGSFHNTYGTKNNTKEQFEEYANRIKNGTTMP